MKSEHESYGMIDISRFSSNKSEFFGSDLLHNGGISITISTAEVDRGYSSDWYYPTKRLIEVEMSHNQFVDAITSGMNTSGVPCTIKHVNGEVVPQINHASNKKDTFKSEMQDTYDRFNEMIDDMISLTDGNIGKKKMAEIKHNLKILKMHISSNTNFVMRRFNEEMDKTILEAKHSIANYIDHKVSSLGIEALREEMKIGLKENND